MGQYQMSQATPTPTIQPNDGDLLFYSGAWNNPMDAAIMARTHSPYVHVAVVFDAISNTIISARTGGITADKSYGSYSVLARTSTLIHETGRLKAALDWLATKVGQPYGWADIANQGLLLLGKDPILLDKSYDCSHLACDFLWIAGVFLPPRMIEENTVTPGNLANAMVGSLFTPEGAVL